MPTKTAADKSLPVSDRLAALGYGHRDTANSHNTGQREVYVIETGEVVGHFSVFEAIERFLSADAR